MGGPSLHEERRLSLCSLCEQVRGEIVGVSVGHGLRTIRYRCPRCQNEWQHAVALPNDQTIFRGFLKVE